MVFVCVRVKTKHDANYIQSNLSTTVNHGELQKWPFLTGGHCSEKLIQS